MSFKFVLFGIMLLMTIVFWSLFVFFGKKTVRKLRKNSSTKDALGIEIISGWDIFHVINALAWPKWLSRKTRKSLIRAYFSDADILKQHVTSFDILLARLVFCLWG